MRIAVSGTHGVGKTTLVEDFAAAHPGYEMEPEPYETLIEAGALFSSPPALADYVEQLELSLEMLRSGERRARVIFDRCPVDFVAYLVAVNRLGRDGEFGVEWVLDDVREAIATLDLIVFLPLPKSAVLEVEYPALQRAVDRELRAIFLEDSLALFEETGPPVALIRGSPEERLRAVERAMAERTPSGTGPPV